MEDILGLIEFIRKEFNKSLNSFSFPKIPSYLYGPIEYSLKGKGKRFRPIIVHLTGRHFKSDPDDAAVADAFGTSAVLVDVI